MKIDITRKIPEYMETIIIFQEDHGSINNVDLLPSNIAKTVQTYIKSEGYNFAYGEIRNLTIISGTQKQNIILLGAGNKNELNNEKIRKLFASSIRLADKLKANQVYLFMGFISPINDVALGHILTETALMVTYKFNKYKSKDKSEHEIDALHLVLSTKSTRHLNRGIVEGRIYAETTNLARNLVNEPANIVTPEYLAEAAKQAALQYSFSIEVFSQDKLKRIKMDAFLAVGRASTHEPKLIIMRYNGNPDKKQETLALIGKGITFDSGGLCLKSSQGMLNMKSDMGGAAAIIGTMCAISAMKLKVNVVGVIAACENMISGDAYHAGDIITTMSGKTIEVVNTDAEGRLTLCDAIHYAIEKEHADRIIDIATLTGAAVGALGTEISAVITNNYPWLEQLKIAANFTGENIWQLPTYEDYKEQIKSEIADLRNSGGSFAGTITAGLFLKEFVQDKPWLHIDIAGTALKDRESGIYNYGATGVGVRLLTTLLKSME
ncbi:MAG: leucyl aminopeptidase [Candidatus Cloacimonas sp.]|nr:leucyl aminopeptidase [Candidatus Cloacimonas sp.]